MNRQNVEKTKKRLEELGVISLNELRTRLAKKGVSPNIPLTTAMVKHVESYPRPEEVVAMGLAMIMYGMIKMERRGNPL